MPAHQRRNPTAALNTTKKLSGNLQNILLSPINVQAPQALNMSSDPHIYPSLLSLIKVLPLQQPIKGENKQEYMVRTLRAYCTSLHESLFVELIPGENYLCEFSSGYGPPEELKNLVTEQYLLITNIEKETYNIHAFLNDPELLALSPGLPISIATLIEQSAPSSLNVLFFNEAFDAAERAYWYGDAEGFTEEIIQYALEYIESDTLSAEQLDEYCDAENITLPQDWGKNLEHVYPQYKEDRLSLQDISTTIERLPATKKEKIEYILNIIKEIQKLDKKVVKNLPQSHDKLLEHQDNYFNHYHIVLEPQHSEKNDLGIFGEINYELERMSHERETPDRPILTHFVSKTPEETRKGIQCLKHINEIREKMEDVLHILEIWTQASA